MDVFDSNLVERVLINDWCVATYAIKEIEVKVTGNNDVRDVVVYGFVDLFKDLITGIFVCRSDQTKWFLISASVLTKLTRDLVIQGLAFFYKGCCHGWSILFSKLWTRVK